MLDAEDRVIPNHDTISEFRRSYGMTGFSQYLIGSITSSDQKEDKSEIFETKTFDQPQQRNNSLVMSKSAMKTQHRHQRKSNNSLYSEL